MKVLVVGAGGYIGRRLCAHLEGHGHYVVRASSRDGTSVDAATGLLAPGFTVPIGTDVVVYLAQSPYGARLPFGASAYVSANTVSAVAVGERALDAGVRRFLFASTGSVYVPSVAPLGEGSPVRRDNWYALSKLHGEELLSLYAGSLSVLSCRLFGVYGPGQTGRLVANLIRRVKGGEPIDLQRAAHEEEETEGLRISLLYIGDLVWILEALMVGEVDGVLNVASTEAMSVRGMASEIARQLGTRPRFRLLKQPRQGDFVADVTRLQQAVSPAFTPFAVGLRAMLGAQGHPGPACR